MENSTIEFNFMKNYLVNNSYYLKNNIKFIQDKINLSLDLYIPLLLSFYESNYFLINSLLSTLFTIFLINKYFRKKKSKLNNFTIKLDTYLDKGSDEFKNITKKELSETQLKELKNNSIQEVTPSGNIILSYDFDLSAFIYYADEDIPYKYLEVVSRLFVNKYDCTNLYIDYKEELFKARDLFLEKKNKNVEKEQIKSLYAINKNKKLPNNTNVYISPERSNKYIKKGKIKDLREEERKVEREKIKTEKIKDISFKDFKNKL